MRRERERDPELPAPLFFTLGAAEATRAFLAKLWPEARAIADPAQRFYAAFELGHGSAGKYLGPGVWAAGDCTGKAWLAHTATRMGEVAVNNMTGRADRYRANAIPGVVYTQPGIPVKVAKMMMGASGRYLAETDGERGIVKVVLHAETNVLLGVHMIGGACSEMIWGAAALVEAEFRAKEIEEIVFPHPTVSELTRDSIFTLH